MSALEREQSSNCSNPVLDAFVEIGTTRTDIYSAEFIIYEKVSNPPNLVQAYPPSGREAVDVSTDCPTGHRLSIGRYVAEWDVPADALVGAYEIHWFWKLTAAHPEQQFVQEFSVTLQGAMGSSDGYCTVQDLRDEGITVAMMSDIRAGELISEASRYIERMTGRWFEARDRTFKIRGKRSKVVHLPHPIIKIDNVNLVTGRGSGANRDAITVDDLIVFNRHLTEGLTNPDDRDNPKLEYISTWGIDYPNRDDALFPKFSQVVEVIGTFGYTELAHGVTPGETSSDSQVPSNFGITPLLITKVCKLLVVREIGLMVDFDDREDFKDRHRITEEKTVDQSYKKTSISDLKMTGMWTGDPEIDGLIALFVASPDVQAV
jgi:hypothetical protein